MIQNRNVYKKGFIAINLNDSSVKKLREVFPPRHKKEFYHHVTIAFKPEEEVYKTFEPYFGTEAQMKVTGEVSDQEGQAILVESALSQNKDPHVTLSCIEGVPPKYSQDLAQAHTNFIPVKDIEISGVITWEEWN